MLEFFSYVGLFFVALVIGFLVGVRYSGKIYSPVLDQLQSVCNRLVEYVEKEERSVILELADDDDVEEAEVIDNGKQGLPN